jgi:hypothetical protein
MWMSIRGVWNVSLRRFRGKWVVDDAQVCCCLGRGCLSFFASTLVSNACMSISLRNNV